MNKKKVKVQHPAKIAKKWNYYKNNEVKMYEPNDLDVADDELAK